MALTVVYDACVLWSAPLRDLLVRLAIAGLVQAKWSEAILDETFRSIRARRPELSSENLARTRLLMNRAVRDCLVHGHDELIRSLHLPDPDDRHVLAVGIHAGARAIITFNLNDFPATVLASHQLEVLHPDDFVCDLLDVAEGVVLRVLQEQAEALRHPPRTVEDLVGTLEGCGLSRSMARVRMLLGGG